MVGWVTCSTHLQHGGAAQDDLLGELEDLHVVLDLVHGAAQAPQQVHAALETAPHLQLLRLLALRENVAQVFLQLGTEDRPSCGYGGPMT